MNPYEILGVSAKAPDFVIQAAYRSLLKKYHPDKYSGNDARELTARIIDAYKIVGDPVARANFDRKMSPNGTSKQSGAGTAKNAPPSPPKPSTPNKGADGRSRQIGGRSIEYKSLVWVVLGALVILAIVIVNLQGKSSTDYDSMIEAAADTVEMPAEEAMGANESGTVATKPLEQGEVLSDLFSSTSPLPVDLPSNPPPIAFATVESATKAFSRALRSGGMNEARKRSEKCHLAVKTNPTWDGLDYCASFDFAAAILDRYVTKETKWSRNGYFEFQENNQADYFGSRQYLANSRLYKLKSATVSAVDQIDWDSVLRSIMLVNTESQATEPKPKNNSASNAPNTNLIVDPPTQGEKDVLPDVQP